MPVPAFVRLPVPLMIPEAVVLELSPPAVRVKDPSVTLPAPAIEPMVSLAPKFKTAPLATLTAPVSIIALPPLSVSVPALMVVAPV